MEDKKLKQISLKMTSDRNDYMSAFRKNIFTFLEDKDITLSEVAEKADISFSTLRTFLYGDATDCKLSTAVKLARAFGISMDELVGAETIENETRQTIAMSRNLKDHHRYVIRLFAKHQYLLHGEVPQTSKQISVLLPECQYGHLKTTNLTEALNIDFLPKEMRSEVCLGLKIPCSHYEPYYIKEEILLLGAHREGFDKERCVVSKDGNLYLCIKNITKVNGTKLIKYVSMIDQKNVLFTSQEMGDKIGYVVGFLHPDLTLGIR